MGARSLHARARALLFGVTTKIRYYVAVAGALAVVAMVASYVPRVEPPGRSDASAATD